MATLAVAGVGAALLALRSLLKRPSDALLMAMLTGGALMAVAWTPPGWRMTLFVVGGALVALGVGGGPGGAIATGVFFYLIENNVPGGTTAIILLILAIVGYFQTRSAILHLVRLSRTGALVPGERTRKEVELVGTVVGPDVPVPGLDDITAAAWKLDSLSSDYVTIETAVGPAFAEVASAELDSDVINLTKEQVTALFDALNAKREPRMKAKPSDSELRVLRAGEPAFAVGIPDWEVSPRGGAGYRDADVVPVLRRRTKSGKPVFVANRSETEVRRGSWWTLANWAGWGLACAWLATLMFGFGL